MRQSGRGDGEGRVGNMGTRGGRTRRKRMAVQGEEEKRRQGKCKECNRPLRGKEIKSK